MSFSKTAWFLFKRIYVFPQQISRYFEASTQDPFLPFPDMLGVVSRLPIIPSTTEYPGHMGFQVFFGTLTESASESSTWTYSDVYKRLYVNLASYCPIKFKTNKPPPRGTILRAVAVFKGSTNIHDVVKRCPIHMESSNDGNFFSFFVYYGGRHIY